MKSPLKMVLIALSVIVSATSCSSVDEDAVAKTPNSRRAMNVIDVMASDREAPMAKVTEDKDTRRSAGQIFFRSGDQGVYKGPLLDKDISDYVKNLAQDLIANMEQVSEQTPVAITTFALLDSDLQQTNLLGQQMSESFMHELHKFRIPVVDFKATTYIRVTESGDFLLSRDYLELNNELPVEYVLTGTLAKHQGGVMVNARILGLENRRVMASAQTFIPFYVVDALIPSNGSVESENSDSIKLSRG
ncbi:hypothetical protein CA267_016440 [Alteromonas pelagimontana]|uniref:FlgO domain-containing protein n=1 Tax=Alteromonas pelagimontana TaxID=1858656 RepID=A0A6M4MGB0_9ALTE|nr:FlgO family outer membrane protein [Alteromonas pelagimontana]QJR82224.1 hypothetical protein CA267_016440 [Alteromonas pelagimontana]